MSNFSDFQLNKQLFNAISDLGFTEPTPIQQKAIPPALAGQDIMGIAQTGTGKSAAYLLPLLMKIKYHQEPGPRAVIFSPTRELAMQIKQMAIALSTYTDIKIAVIVGGTGMKQQIEEINEGIDLLIATPGRFMDIYLKGELPLKFIKTLVLDEADRIMDMGFMPQIRRILEVIPVKRQNMLFSATMSPKVIELSHEFLEFPIKIEITPQATAVETVQQILYNVPNVKTKINFLEFLLKQEGDPIIKAIIFARRKSTAENVYKFIVRKNLASARVIHGNKGQNTRINALDEFRNEDVRILVTTDVTARGIDIENVSHVINFDVPVLYEEYVHRIGRTGRALKEGKAITFCNASEKYHIEKIEELIREKIPVGQIPGEVKIEKTPDEEKQLMAREIDHQKRKEDPEFKGAFHEKKKVYPPKKPKTKRRK